MEVAQRLHTAIETYRIPAGIRKKTGRKKMGLVFRDQEELPLSSDLGKDIENSYNALEHQYLVKFNLTFGLFWIRPDLYLPLDSRSQNMLNSIGITFDNTKFLRYKEYKEVMNRLDVKMQTESFGFSNYAEFSYIAFLNTSKKQEKEDEDGNTIAYWLYAPGEQAVYWDEYYHARFKTVFDNTEKAVVLVLD